MGRHPFSRDLPDPGIEPLSPALAGSFFTTVPLGKPPSWAEGSANRSFLAPYLSPDQPNVNSSEMKPQAYSLSSSASPNVPLNPLPLPSPPEVVLALGVRCPGFESQQHELDDLRQVISDCVVINASVNMRIIIPTS